MPGYYLDAYDTRSLSDEFYFSRDFDLPVPEHTLMMCGVLPFCGEGEIRTRELLAGDLANLLGWPLPTSPIKETISSYFEGVKFFFCSLSKRIMAMRA